MTLAEFFNISNISFMFAILISTLNAVMLIFLARKFFQILQLSGYKIKGYNHWLKDTKAKYVSRLLLLTSLSLCCVLVINFLLDISNTHSYFAYIGFLLYLYFAITLVVNVWKTPQKTPLVQTRRMSRLMTLLFLIGFIISFVFIWFSTVYLPFLDFGAVVLTPILLPILVPLVHFILLPLEAFIRHCYIQGAKQKLKKYSNLIKIGITGSYGKTSVKHILNKLLEKKYNVCMTPHSFNTPMGITKVVLKYLKPENEVLITEMGAKQKGDIKYLCDIIHPMHAILTGIGNQHYETFGNQQNIIDTKNELVLSLPQDANVVFNIESENSKKLFEKCKLKNKFAVSFENGDILSVSDIKLSVLDTEFTLIYGKKHKNCKTKLIGKQNILNILLASTLALKLGVEFDDIVDAINELEPINHRLEPLQNQNMIILDDAYSSNEEGAKCALEVLALAKDATKICITPGIVELGKEEKQINKNFGKQIAKSADFVVIVNKINENALKEGLLENGFNEKNIITADTLNESKIKLKDLLKPDKKYVVLFMNDLPDNYT